MAGTGIEVTDTTSVAFLVAVAGAIGAFANRLLAAWQAKAAADTSAKTQRDQIEMVDGPRVRDQGWAAFAASIQTGADKAVERVLTEMASQREHFEDRIAGFDAQVIDLRGQIVELREQLDDQSRELERKDDVIREREITIARRDEAIEMKDRALDDRDGVIKRLRAQLTIVTNLLRKCGQDVPEFHDDSSVAPERREPTIAMPAITTIVEHAPPHS